MGHAYSEASMQESEAIYDLLMVLYRAARGDWEKLANTVKVNSESVD
jgi:hypothetical protein